MASQRVFLGHRSIVPNLSEDFEEEKERQLETIEYTTEKGEKVLVEVSRVDGTEHTSEFEDVGLGRTFENATQRAKLSLERSLETIPAVVSAIKSKIDEVAERPDEVSVEFGLKLTGTTKAKIVQIGSEMSFKITLTWNNKQE